MAEQINPKLTEPSDSVDLDNLFAFLSDVQQAGRNPIIDEIGQKMNELVSDLDVEASISFSCTFDFCLSRMNKHTVIEVNEYSVLHYIVFSLKL